MLLMSRFIDKIFQTPYLNRLNLLDCKENENPRDSGTSKWKETAVVNNGSTTTHSLDRSKRLQVVNGNVFSLNDILILQTERIRCFAFVAKVKGGRRVVGGSWVRAPVPPTWQIISSPVALGNCLQVSLTRALSTLSVTITGLKSYFPFNGLSTHLDANIVRAAYNKNATILGCQFNKRMHDLQQLDESTLKSFESCWDRPDDKFTVPMSTTCELEICRGGTWGRTLDPPTTSRPLRPLSYENRPAVCRVTENVTSSVQMSDCYAELLAVQKGRVSLPGRRETVAPQSLQPPCEAPCTHRCAELGVLLAGNNNEQLRMRTFADGSPHLVGWESEEVDLHLRHSVNTAPTWGSVLGDNASVKGREYCLLAWERKYSRARIKGKRGKGRGEYVLLKGCRSSLHRPYLPEVRNPSMRVSRPAAVGRSRRYSEGRGSIPSKPRDDDEGNNFFGSVTLSDSGARKYLGAVTSVRDLLPEHPGLRSSPSIRGMRVSGPRTLLQ
ncbi:hypothetical protein PR048_018340 [Dryococelus australis]|uniref:Uncharacterized protein n=1 Tax=Dryococelus australis TaxID=614101 RepID=A0ABQ9HC60_9NEOP|nr:hypothetical protein PR048_018340 [Dryococelus australis]